MPSAKNMERLNAMLTNQLRKAMKAANQAALADMQEATDSFYAGGQPKKYERTGALGETPEVTNVKMSFDSSGGSGEFTARLNEKHQYTTGKKPTMAAVLKLANDWDSPPPPHHLRETVGQPEFWQEAEREMERSLNAIIAEHFN